MKPDKPSYAELEARVEDAEALVAEWRRRGGDRSPAELRAGEPSDSGDAGAAPPPSPGVPSTEAELRTLSDALVRMNRARSIEDMCLLMAERAYQLNPRAYVVVSLFDPQLGAITVRRVLGFGRVVDAGLKVLGSDPRRLSYAPEDMTAEERALFTSGRLEAFPGGVHELMTRKVPRPLCRAFESLLGVAQIHTAGFALQDQPRGGLVVLVRQGEPLRAGLVLEILANQISMALHRQQALQALRDAELEKRLVLDAQPNPVLLQDLDYRITWANQPASRWLGRPLAELVGRRCYELWAGEELSCGDCPVRRSVRSGHIEEAIKEIGDRTLRVLGSPVRDETGAIVSAVQVVEDITERLELEAQLRHSQRLESVGQLAGGVAHDFNNLLTPLLSYADMLLLDADDPALVSEYAREIQSAAERAGVLTRQLLAFGRKQTLDLMVVDLNQVLRDVQGLLRRTIRENVHLDCQPSSTALPVMADPSQLEQVLMNLAVNAQDAMPGGGKVTLETSRVQWGSREGSRVSPPAGPGVTRAAPTPAGDPASVELPPGPAARLVVRDTGHGMPPEVCDRVFEPFYTTKEKGKGTGLGLATVYGIVKQHGGDITVSSTPGEGAVFEIHLPLTAERQRSRRARSSRELPMVGRETILVVEDDDQVRQLAHRILASYGYDVHTAASLPEALAVLQTPGLHVELLLTDVVMPDYDGKQVYERLAEREPGLRVVYMSGHDEDIISRHGVLDPEVTLVKKPFSARALAAAVRAVLD
jgi:PAS domain S-box-containing protein